MLPKYTIYKYTKYTIKKLKYHIMGETIAQRDIVCYEIKPTVPRMKYVQRGPLYPQTL